MERFERAIRRCFGLSAMAAPFLRGGLEINSVDESDAGTGLGASSDQSEQVKQARCNQTTADGVSEKAKEVLSKCSKEGVKGEKKAQRGSASTGEKGRRDRQLSSLCCICCICSLASGYLQVSVSPSLRQQGQGRSHSDGRSARHGREGRSSASRWGNRISLCRRCCGRYVRR